MPSTLKRRLAREVARRESTLNDIAVELLAERYGVAFEPSGRKGNVPGDTGVVLLRVPPQLKQRLDADARERKSSTNKVIVEALTEQLGGASPPRKEPMAQRNGSQNGKARSKDKVRVAIIGVGNCANSLLQGVEYYKDAAPDQFVPGLMHVDLGGYHVRDIEFTAAFDVTKDKVGKELSEAIWAHPNDTIKFSDVPKTGITVSRGMTHDGLGKYISEVVEKAPGDTDDVVGILQETGTDVVVNYLPVGSEEATKWYTEQILQAGCAMVNCMPVFIAKGGYYGSSGSRRRVFRSSATTSSPRSARPSPTACLTSLYRERGVHLDKTMQLNVGGNSDFLNMLERDRPRVEEDLEDERGHVDARLRPRREERPRRPFGLRALADRPQVGVHPHGGLRLRRRAAEHRAEARGLGLAELGRHRHRRSPPREARPGQRRRRRAGGAERVPDEVTAEADPGRRRVRRRRGVHQAVRPQDGEVQDRRAP